MVDLPLRRTRTGNELTDQIFEGPLKHVSKIFSNFHGFLNKSGLYFLLKTKSVMKIGKKILEIHEQEINSQIKSLKDL